MKLILMTILTLASAVSFAQGLRKATYPSSYHTHLFKLQNMTCDANQVRNVLTTSGQVLARLCTKEYRDCMFMGACLIENQNGQVMGLNYHKYDEVADQSYFIQTDLSKCPYGHGTGKVSATRAGVSCLIPYFSVSADPLVHTLGDVLYIPALVGLKLPTGETHDGYLIVTDHAGGDIGTGFDKYSFFTGTQDSEDPLNAFKTVGLTRASTNYQYKVITGAKALEVQKKKGFKVIRTYKHTFKDKSNPMLDQ